MHLDQLLLPDRSCLPFLKSDRSMEALVIASCDMSPGGSCMVTNLQTNSMLRTLKQNTCSQFAIAATKKLLVIAQRDQPVLKIYNWHKETPDHKMILPEVLNTICLSSDGIWLLGGSVTGKVYLWEMASGILYFAKSAHYQSVTKCAISDDQKSFVTTSADGTAHIWRFRDILCTQAEKSRIKPLLSITNHTRAITDMHIGSGNAASTNLYTASLDNTLRVSDLYTGQTLSTFVLPATVTCMAVDSAEQICFAGTGAGSIIEIKFYREDRTIHTTGDLETIITGKTEVGDTFQGHASAITAMTLNFDGNILISGDAEGHVILWDVTNKQIIKQIEHQMPITAVYTLTTIAELSVAEDRHTTNLIPLKRVQNERDFIEHEAILQLHARNARKLCQAESEVTDPAIAFRTLAADAADLSDTNTVKTLERSLCDLRSAYNGLLLKHEELRRDCLVSHI